MNKTILRNAALFSGLFICLLLGTQCLAGCQTPTGVGMATAPLDGDAGQYPLEPTLERSTGCIEGYFPAQLLTPDYDTLCVLRSIDCGAALRMDCPGAGVSWTGDLLPWGPESQGVWELTHRTTGEHIGHFVIDPEDGEPLFARPGGSL